MIESDGPTRYELSTARENRVTVEVDFASGRVRSVLANDEREMADATRRAQQEAHVRLLTTASA